ncbi:uncharacterized protein LOC111120162 isoform X2 [Crassostrea virginica]
MDFKKSISQKIVHQDGKNNKADSSNCCFGFINKTGTSNPKTGKSTNKGNVDDGSNGKEDGDQSPDATLSKQSGTCTTTHFLKILKEDNQQPANQEFRGPSFNILKSLLVMTNDLERNTDQGITSLKESKRINKDIKQNFGENGDLNDKSLNEIFKAIARYESEDKELSVNSRIEIYKILRGSALRKHPVASQIWTYNSKRLAYTLTA